MAIEAERGCGYRKCGALYLVSDGVGQECGRLPLPCDQPSTRHGVRLVDLVDLLKPGQEEPCAGAGIEFSGACRRSCPARWPVRPLPIPKDWSGPLPIYPEVGLSWVGAQFYSPTSFAQEALTLGVSKRIAGIPEGIVIGKTWVFLAHPKAWTRPTCVFCDQPPPDSPLLDCPELDDGKCEFTAPGIFYGFVPRRIECLVEDDRLDEQWVKDLLDRGVVIIEVPRDDPDHARGTASDERRTPADGRTGSARRTRSRGVAGRRPRKDRG